MAKKTIRWIAGKNRGYSRRHLLIAENETLCKAQIPQKPYNVQMGQNDVDCPYCLTENKMVAEL